MAYRGGWGRGRGRGRGQMPRAKLLPYILFPEDVVLPSMPDSLSNEERKLIQSKYKLELFWSGSCYHLKQESFTRSKEKSKFGKEVEDVEIERYSDRHKQRTHAKREALESYLKKIPSNFPSELIQGVKQSQRATKKLRWDRDLGDVLAKLEEEESKGGDGKKAKERESNENDSGDEEGEEKKEEDEEYSDDGDYNQNVDFDDDEDDMNMEDEPEEDYYE